MAIVKGNPILECLLNTNANATKKSSLIEQKYVNEICLDLLLIGILISHHKVLMKCIEIVNINNTEKKTKEVSDYNLSDNVDRIESINDDCTAMYKYSLLFSVK